MKNQTLISYHTAEVDFDPSTKQTVLGLNPKIWQLDISAPAERHLLLHFYVPEWKDLKMLASRTSVYMNSNELRKKLYLGTELPRLNSKLYKGHWRQDQWTVLFPPQSFREEKSQIIIVPQPNQLVPEQLLKNMIDESTSLNLTLIVKSVSAMCLYWEEDTEEWIDKGCWVINTPVPHSLGSTDVPTLSVFLGCFQALHFILIIIENDPY